MADNAQETGTKDEHYNLISVLYHALQGGETVGKYLDDAQQSGDQESVEFFRQTQAAYKELAEKAKARLKGKLS